MRETKVQAQSTCHLETVATALSLGAQSLKSDKNGIFALPLCVYWSLTCSKRHTTPHCCASYAVVNKLKYRLAPISEQ